MTILQLMNARKVEINGVKASQEDKIDLVRRMVNGMPCSVSVDFGGGYYFSTEESASNHPEMRLDLKEVFA